MNTQNTKSISSIVETFYEYDENNRLIREYRSDGLYDTHNEYDEHGNLIRQVSDCIDSVDAMKFTTIDKYDYQLINGKFLLTRHNVDDEDYKYFHYDSDGRLILEIDLMSCYEKYYTYDKSGNRTRILKTYMDKSQGMVLQDISCVYDEFNLLIFDHCDEYATCYDYEYHNDKYLLMTEKRMFNMGTVHITTYVYDDCGRVIQKTSPEQMREYTYDDNGNLVKSRYTNYQY